MARALTSSPLTTAEHLSGAPAALRFAVLTLAGQNWENLWWSDGVRITYASKAEAKADLRQHFADMKAGGVEFSPRDYRIRAVRDWRALAVSRLTTADHVASALPGLVAVIHVPGFILWDAANGPDWVTNDRERYGVDAVDSADYRQDGGLGAYDTIGEALAAHPELCDVQALREAEAALRHTAQTDHWDASADDVTPAGQNLRDTADALDQWIADSAGFPFPLAPLAVEWAQWCRAQGLPCMDALELTMSERLTGAQSAYVADFVTRWDAAQDTLTA